jgi:hypothetical protein
MSEATFSIEHLRRKAAERKNSKSYLLEIMNNHAIKNNFICVRSLWSAFRHGGLRQRSLNLQAGPRQPSLGGHSSDGRTARPAGHHLGKISNKVNEDE